MQVPEITNAASLLPDWSELLIRLLIDSVTLFILVRGIYYPIHRRKDYLFTFFLFNLVLFMICILLGASMMKMGFAFGLFAIFSMIRYRTVSIPIKEMGYFFVCVAMGMINALATVEYNYIILLAANLLIVLAVLLLDKFVLLKHENRKEIIYDKIEWITPQNRLLLIEDLVKRTGMPIHRVEVVNINFLRDVALLAVYYYDNEIQSSEAKMNITE
ncbi:MAG: DUF4956 domain-containing protein [Chitinophagaceae bacterium]|jgi:hypothetical protein